MINLSVICWMLMVIGVLKGVRNLKFERVKRIEAEIRIPASIKEVADNRYCM